MILRNSIYYKQKKGAIYEVCPEGIQPCNIKTETFIEDTRYKKHCTQDNEASVPFKVGTLRPHTVSESHNFLHHYYFDLAHSEIWVMASCRLQLSFINYFRSTITYFKFLRNWTSLNF